MKATDLEKKLGRKKHKTTSELKQLISTRTEENPNFCLFLGSGASRSSGIRTAGEMVKQWRVDACRNRGGPIEHCTVDEMQKWLSENEMEWYDQDREYASFIEHFFPLARNRRQFIETEVAENIPSIGYAYLVRVAEAGFLRTLFTTNFDDLLNEAFYQFSSERALICPHDSSVHTISITSRRTKIIKLHGDYLFDDIKNTQKETHNLGKNMEEKLSEFLKEYGLIMVGYSGSDRSITQVLGRMSEDPLYLRNGLFWCFRESDEITKEALGILEQPNSFYVLTEGFDELMAELYSMCGTDATPFNAKLASDRASSIIDSYITNEHLKLSKSPIIRAHLQALEADKDASLVSDLMKDLNSERNASAGLTDKNFLVYLEIERALKGRNPELALAKLCEELAKATDKRFKEILLRQRFRCSLSLSKFGEAKEAANQLLISQPANFYMALNECSLIQNRGDRLLYLQKLKGEHPFSSSVLNTYARELEEALDKRDKATIAIRSEDIIAALDRSVEIDPALDNEAWSLLFDFYSKLGDKSREKLTQIVDAHLMRDAFDPKTGRMLLQYCQKFKTKEYKGRDLFDYLLEANAKHFPRQRAEHLGILVESCIEFEAHRVLRPIVEEARESDELKQDADFAMIMMDVYFDVFRDLSGAIVYGREFLNANKDPSVEVKLFHLCIANKSPEKARELHKRLKGAIHYGSWLKLESKLLEAEGRYQDAIDTLENIPDKRDWKERFTSNLAYLDLKMDKPARAQKRCRELLEERVFSTAFETEIINYEYAKKMDGGKVNKERIAGLAKYTQQEMVKAVCHSLLEEDQKAIELFRKQAEKRYSKIVECLEWPVVSKHKKELTAIRDDLLKAKRSLTDLPNS